MNPLVSRGKSILVIFCFFLIFSFFASPSFTPTRFIAVSHAQTNALRITVVPQFPGPFETVTVDVEDFSRDLNKVDISWSVNGKIEQRGVGLKRLRLNTGALGTVTNISINMGGDIQSLTVRPATVDVLWQADTYTPPFYRGKAIHSNQDPITVVAEPFFINSQGVRLDPEKLIYRWTRNGKLNDLASGYGKKTFRIVPSILMKPIDVEVEVSSVDGIFHSVSSINIPDSKTEVLLYENHPLYGIVFERALNAKESPITNHEIRIIGVPFFFSNQQKNLGQLVYDWKLNNASVNQPGNEVIFRKPEGGGEGRSLVSLGIKNPERFAQSSSASLHVQFKDEEETPAGQNIF
ncbi:MAG: hypothetical protein AAB635_00705 [Patescibacteria group bacterium]